MDFNRIPQSIVFEFGPVVLFISYPLNYVSKNSFMTLQVQQGELLTTSICMPPINVHTYLPARACS